MYTLYTEDMHTSMQSHLPMQTDLDDFRHRFWWAKAHHEEAEHIVQQVTELIS